MFILRLMLVAICAVMLLPMEDTRVRPDGSPASAQNFCDRYPKTCDASGELWSAFKLKLAYAVKLARRELGAQSTTRQQHYVAPQQLGQLYGRPQNVNGHYSNGTLSPSERRSEWPRTPR